MPKAGVTVSEARLNFSGEFTLEVAIAEAIEFARRCDGGKGVTLVEFEWGGIKVYVDSTKTISQAVSEWALIANKM